jgi:hypothetical protein
MGSAQPRCCQSGASVSFVKLLIQGRFSSISSIIRRAVRRPKSENGFPARRFDSCSDTSIAVGERFTRVDLWVRPCGPWQLVRPAETHHVDPSDLSSRIGRRTEGEPPNAHGIKPSTSHPDPKPSAHIPLRAPCVPAVGIAAPPLAVRRSCPAHLRSPLGPHTGDPAWLEL